MCRYCGSSVLSLKLSKNYFCRKTIKLFSVIIQYELWARNIKRKTKCKNPKNLFRAKCTLFTKITKVSRKYQNKILKIFSVCISTCKIERENKNEKTLTSTKLAVFVQLELPNHAFCRKIFKFWKKITVSQSKHLQ